MLRLLLALSLTLLLAVYESGCNKRHVAAPVPSTPAPSVAPEPAETTAPATPANAAAPSPPAQNTQPPPSPSPPATAPTTPAPQASPTRRAPRTGETANPTHPVNPAPRLGDILTPDQERQYNSAIDQSLARTQSSLALIANHRLTREQQGVVAQIQGFIQQAQTTRKSNLSAARSLAERADVLAKDLAGSLR